ncbi:MAG TPA: hypothetical protein VFM09_11500 [Marmoricola sp.]|nr:hypothetical protein [Marmoricola sp.]
MIRPSLPKLVGSLAVLAVTAGLGTTVAAAPATSATSADCPAAYPVDQLQQGDAVHGLTVSHGTTPDPFDGSVIGVLQDGIAQGVPMIMVKLTSPEIDDIGGIWEGMSGSPVYAANGDLIGAVAYGLSYGPSPIAGVTPAADMQQLYTEGGSASTAAARTVAVPTRMAARLVASGDATQQQADGGYTPLRTPLVISGMQAQARRADLAKGLGLTGRVLAGSAASSSGPAYPVTAGGNLVAALSHGAVTAAAIGTATEVCNGQVIGFGHPFTFAGDTSYTMHGADTLYVQPDSLGAAYKVANLGAPVGTVTGDHLTGIAGTLLQTPQEGQVSSAARMGTRRSHGTTYVSAPDFTPDLAASTMAAEQDRAMDYIGKGSSRATWQIDGTRSNGVPFEVNRTDYYSDGYDISYATAGDLFGALYRITSADPGARIGNIATTTVVDKQPGSYHIASVQARIHGVWQKLRPSSVVNVRAGDIRRFRVQLTSPALGQRTVTVTLSVPNAPLGSVGSVTVYGPGYEDGEMYYYGGPQQSLGAVIKDLNTSPRHDQVVAALQGRGPWHQQAQAVKATHHVVTGERFFSVRVTP